MLEDLVTQIVERIIPEEKQSLTAEVLKSIAESMPANYHWPGNIRELEQCVRNIMICGRCYPATKTSAKNSTDATVELPSELLNLACRMQTVDVTADEVLQHYCYWAWRQTGSFDQAARRLLLDTLFSVHSSTWLWQRQQPATIPGEKRGTGATARPRTAMQFLTLYVIKRIMILRQQWDRRLDQSG
jgi:transcriptional regulator with GAF, ATPase, and Fis domain